MEFLQYIPLGHTCSDALDEDLEGQHVNQDGKEGDGRYDYCRKTELPGPLMCGFGHCGGLFDGGHSALQLFGEFFDMRGIL